MLISRVSIKNFRALADVQDFPLGHFSCIIGENNAGKSSFLHALLLFRQGGMLPEADYYNIEEPFVIELDLSQITEDDWARIVNEEHRKRYQELALDQSLTLRRIFPSEERGRLECAQLVPRDERLREEAVASFVSGKKPAEMKAMVGEDYPEIADGLESYTQKAVREAVEAHRQTLPASEFTREFGPLKGGIEGSISNLLPEPIYIPAVKEIADELRTKDAAMFGKVMGLLLNVIRPQLDKEQALFAELDRKLNRVRCEDGSIDYSHRLPEIGEVEQTIQRHLRENFEQAKVEIRIPPPDLKAVLSNARLELHDGALAGSVETKGDGLKRSVLFSIFRAYADFACRPGWGREPGAGSTPQYLFLFEEPELYLHPGAQQTLFEALGVLAQDHQVLVTTHSPLFFSADSTATFGKFAKRPVPNGGKPATAAMPASFVADMGAKETFRLLSFENSNAAFFATDVVLVEGDSDMIAFKHLAREICPEWSFDGGRVQMIRAGGKDNFKRFAKFFARFGIRVHMIADLDVITRAFDKLGLPEGDPAHDYRSRLLELIDAEHDPQAPRAKKIRDLIDGGTLRDAWVQCRAALKRASQGKPDAVNEAQLLMEAMIEEERRQPRLTALKEDASFQDAKLLLLGLLRRHRIHVLAKGEIEDYYPTGLTGDKMVRAEAMTRRIRGREAALGLCEPVPISDGTDTQAEFEVILKSIGPSGFRVGEWSLKGGALPPHPGPRQPRGRARGPVS